jgi:hypothetical protein
MRRENFDKLIFNPFDLSDQELIEQVENNEKLFSILGGESGIMGSLHTSINRRAKHVRYTFYLYDKESPLWLSDPEIAGRKKHAASLAGYDVLNEPQERLDELFLLKDIHLAKSVSSFIRYQNSADLSALIMNEHIMYELHDGLVRHLNDFKDDKQLVDHYKTKLELTQKQDTLLNLINQYKHNIWQGDKVAEEVVMDVEYGRKAFPEQIALIEIKKPEILR